MSETYAKSTVGNIRDLRRKVWLDQASFASTLVVLAQDIYGTDIYDWSPATILAEIEDDYDLVVSSGIADRLLSGLRLVAQDDFYELLPIFVDTCEILSGGDAPKNLALPDATDCSWGITEALLLSPPENDDPFSDDIRRYLAAVLREEGIIKPPDVLRLAMTDPSELIRISSEYNDDPEFFQLILSVEFEKTNTITANLRDKVRLLIQQLESLPLVNGDVSELSKRLEHINQQQQPASQ